VRAETERVRRMISEGRPGVRKVSRLLAGSLTTRRTRLDAE
jgi:hypothetical protein